MKILTILFIWITSQTGFYFIDYQILHAQILTEPLTHSSFSSRKLKISVNNFSSYLKGKKSWYIGSSLEAIYLSNKFELGINLHFNQSQLFTFMPSHRIFRIEDKEISFDDRTRFIANPDKFKMNIPVSIYNRTQFYSINLFSSISFLNQQVETEAATPIQTDSLLIINWKTNRFNNTLLLGTLLMGYGFNGIDIKAGISNISLLRIGDFNFKYEFSPKALPVLLLNYSLSNSKLSSVFDSRSISFDYQQQFNWNSVIKNRFFETHLFYRRGLDSYSFQIIKISVESPITQQLSIQLGYQNTWSPTGINSFEAFRNWQHSIIFDNHDFLLGNSLPQHKIFMKFSMEFNSKKRIWPIDVVSSNLFYKQFYKVKSNNYTQDPIGKIKLTNKWNEPINISLIVSTTKNSGLYQSPITTINSNSSKEIDLYINLNNKRNKKNVSHEQLIISAEIENESRIIANESIDIFGNNIWNGNISDLELYLSSNNLELKKYSIDLFNSIRKKHKQKGNKVVQKYDILKEFLESIGKGLKYNPDPILSINQDFVQSPLETFNKKSGDCEDLVVYIISLLRYNNIHSAIVDVNPNMPNRNNKLINKNNVGHVFLLVDTGINISELQHLNLNEFQGISRKSENGEKTIWLPLEITEIGNGFNQAFNKGVEYYYNEIINRDDNNYEKKHVYDF